MEGNHDWGLPGGVWNILLAGARFEVLAERVFFSLGILDGTLGCEESGERGRVVAVLWWRRRRSRGGVAIGSCLAVAAFVAMVRT